MSEVFESKFTEEQIDENFKNVNFFDGIMLGLQEALAYEKGDSIAKARTIVRKRNLPNIDVAKERNQLKLTQKSFASVLGVSPRTVEAWESGKCTPSPTAKNLMYLLSEDASLVEKLQFRD